MPIKYSKQTPEQKAKYAETAKRYKARNLEKILAKKEETRVGRLLYNKARKKLPAGHQVPRKKVYDFKTGKSSWVYGVYDE